MRAPALNRRSFLKTSMLASSGTRVAALLANLVPAANAAESQPALPDKGPLPDLGGAIAWLNSAPLSAKSLRGKVVLVNFWTYSCINTREQGTSRRKNHASTHDRTHVTSA
jgi:hypothetical protein